MIQKRSALLKNSLAPWDCGGAPGWPKRRQQTDFISCSSRKGKWLMWAWELCCPAEAWRVSCPAPQPSLLSFLPLLCSSTVMFSSVGISTLGGYMCTFGFVCLGPEKAPGQIRLEEDGEASHQGHYYSELSEGTWGGVLKQNTRVRKKTLLGLNCIPRALDLISNGQSHLLKFHQCQREAHFLFQNG